jgi:hypothetical protein
LRASIGIAIDKIKNYLDQSPADWAAMILHHGLKKRWIEKHLPKQQADSVIENFKVFLNRIMIRMETCPATNRFLPFRFNPII